MIIVGACTTAFMPSFWALPTAILSESAAAASIGMINSVANLGGFAGPFSSDICGRSPIRLRLAWFFFWCRWSYRACWRSSCTFRKERPRWAREPGGESTGRRKL